MPHTIATTANAHWCYVSSIRNLSSVQDREICCYSISCKEKANIDITLQWLIAHSKSQARWTTNNNSNNMYIWHCKNQPLTAWAILPTLHHSLSPFNYVSYYFLFVYLVKICSFVLNVVSQYLFSASKTEPIHPLGFLQWNYLFNCSFLYDCKVADRNDFDSMNEEKQSHTAENIQNLVN